MATNIGKVEFQVGADGSILEPELRRIGRKAGVAGGNEAGDGFENSFTKTMRANMGKLEGAFQPLADRIRTVWTRTMERSRLSTNRFSESITNLRTRWDHFNRTADTPHIFSDLTNLLAKGKDSLKSFGDGADDAGRKMDGFGGKVDSNGRLIKSRIGRLIALWTGLVLAIGEGTATLGSGVGGGLTALISSLGQALIALGGIGGAAFAGIAVQAALAINSIRFMQEQVPAVAASMENFGAVAEVAGRRFADAWGPAVSRFLDTAAAILGNTAIGDAMAASLASITDAFTSVLQGPGFSQLYEALATTIPAALTSLGTGFANVFGGLASVFAAAAPALQVFADLFNTWAADWAARMAEMTASGELQDFFLKAVDSLTGIIGLVGSLGGALGTLFEAGADTGNSMIATLTGLLDKWNEWMQSIEGQKALEAWFSSSEQIFDALLDLVGQLGTVLADLVTPESVERLTNFIGGLSDFLPIAGQILEVFGRLDLLNVFVGLLNAIGELLTPLMPVLLELASAIGEALVEATEKLAPKFGELGEKLLPIITIIAELVISVLPGLITIIISVVDYVIRFTDALLGSAGTTEDFQTAVSVMGDIVGTTFNIIAGIIDGVLTVIGGLLQSTAQFLRGDFSGAFETMQGVVAHVFELVGLDFDEFTNWVNDMGRVAEDVFAWIGRTLGDFGDTVADIFGGVVDWISDAIGWFNDLFGAANSASGAVRNAGGGGGGAGGASQAMASGGILNGPKRILAGEAGPEAIVPLRRALSQVDPSVRWMSAMLQGKQAYGSGGIVGATGKSITVAPGAFVIQDSGDSRRTANDVWERMVEGVMG